MAKRPPIQNRVKELREAHGQMSQAALAKAWSDLKSESPADWESAWAEARKKALMDGGFSVVF